LEVDYPGGESVLDMEQTGSVYSRVVEIGTVGPHGEYNLRAYVDNSTETNDLQLTLDGEDPTISTNLGSPINYEGADNFEIEASDEHTSVSNIDVVLEDSDGDEVETYEKDDCDSDECTFSPDVQDDLDHGNEYTLDISVTDEVGNTNTDEVDFYYDNQYEAGSSPDISPSPGVFEEAPEEYDVALQGDNDEESEVKVICRYEGAEEIDETGFEDVSVDDTTVDYTCDNSDFGMERKETLEVEMVDRAGNSETYTVGDYLYDRNSPTVGNLSAVVGVFNSDFQLSYDAFDTRDVEGLDVDTIHYQVDDMQYSSDEGEEVSHGEADGSFEVDTEGLEAGEHTVYVWAEDRSGKISMREEFSFDFRPDAEPSAGLSVSDSVSVAAGDSKIVYVNVSNTGDLFIGQMELKLESGVFNDSRTLEDLRPGNSTEVMFSVDTDDTDLGKYSMVLSTESPDTSEETEFIVEANSEQDDQINSKYRKYFERYETLEENVSDLRGSLSGSRKERLESNTSAFFSSMEAAEKAKNNGNLYRVKSELANVEKQFQSASSTFEEVKEKHRKAERNQTIGLFLLLFVGLGGSGVAYVALFSDEYYLDLGALQEEFELLEEPVAKVQEVAEQYEVSAEPLENAVEKFSELLAEEEEEIEEVESQTFQGFT
jgi:hypothetical protein